MKTPQRLLAIALIAGLHVSGCIGGLLSIPTAAALQWTLTGETEKLQMTPAVFLCQEEEKKESNELAAEKDGCTDAARCLSQSGKHLTDRSMMISTTIETVPHFLTRSLMTADPPSPAFSVRSGPLIAMVDVHMYPFVQRE